MVDAKTERALTDAATCAIFDAKHAEMQSNGKLTTESMDAWKRAANAHYELGRLYANEQNNIGLIYFLSAINCAVNANNVSFAMLILHDLDAAHFTYNAAQQEEYEKTKHKLQTLV